jgi:hypothetical protein
MHSGRNQMTKKVDRCGTPLNAREIKKAMEQAEQRAWKELELEPKAPGDFGKVRDGNGNVAMVPGEDGTPQILWRRI